MNFVLTFLLVYLVMSLFFKGSTPASTNVSAITITPAKTDFSQNQLVTVKIKNNTTSDATVKNDCPGEPLDVFKKNGDAWQQLSATSKEIDCSSYTPEFQLKAGEEKTLTYNLWNHALFGDLGTYKIAAEVKYIPDQVVGTQATSTQTTSTQVSKAQATATQATSTTSQTLPSTTKTSTPISKTFESDTFTVTPPNFFSNLWTYILYQPIYNALIFIANYLPFHDLGFAIIILTLIIRTILLIPSQNALKSQRKMQELQPKLNKIKEKYKENQEMIAKETMALWQENKVNPFGSCLPLVIQIPALIALFYAIQNGLNPDNAYMLYPWFRNFQLAEINIHFLGILNLTQINHFVLPLIVGALQFGQMKLAFMKINNKKTKEVHTDKPSTTDEVQKASEMMIYIMPIMIAIFTASTPAGVGIYWATTTLYGIGQQVVVNKEVAEETSSVRVITKGDNK